MGHCHQDWIRYVAGQIAAQYTFSGSYPTYTVRWYHYDRLGSVMNLTDTSANVVASYDQDAYGNMISNMTTGQWASSISGRHLTTKEADADAGLYYFWQRWYEPGVGRFASKAYLPSYEEHPYGFAINNPLFYTDPLGLVPGRYKSCHSAYKKCMDKAKNAYERGLCKCDLAVCNKGVDVACGHSPGNEAWCCYVDYVGCLNDCPNPPTQECVMKCQWEYYYCYINAFK